MGDVDERDFDRFEGAVVVEIEAGELANTEFVVDVYTRVDFLAAVPVGFKADAGFEQFDLRGVFRSFFCRRLGFGLFDLWQLLGERRCGEESNEGTKKRDGSQKVMRKPGESNLAHTGSVGRGRKCVKRRLRAGCRICTSQ